MFTHGRKQNDVATKLAGMVVVQNGIAAIFYLIFKIETL